MLGLLLASCGSTPQGEPTEPDGPSGPAKVAKYETFLRNPTEITAAEVRVVIPPEYFPEMRLRGLSDGWQDTGGVREWVGTGDCELAVKSLRVRARSLTVTLGPKDMPPEFMLLAVGNVRLAHSVRGIGSLSEGLTMLHLHNDRRIEK